MTQSNQLKFQPEATEKVFDNLDNCDIRTRLDAYIDRIGSVVSILFLVGMTISVYEIFSRYLFNSPTLWAHESTIFLVAISFAYGGAYCLARNTHISIRLLYDWVSPRTRQIFDIVNSSLGFIYTLAIAWAAFEMTRRSMFTPMGEFRLETSGSAWNQPIPPLVKASLLICIGTMAVQNALHVIKAIRQGPVGPHGTVIDVEAN